MQDIDQRDSILVVDDTPENLRLLTTMLQDRGYRVRPAPNGAIALRAARNDPPDLILLDINMPGMNGYEVCETLKADEHLSDIPVLFLSAASEPQDKIRGFAVGGVDYVTKPFQTDELEARVRTHLELRRARAAVEARNRELAAANAALRELEEMRDGLTHMIVHDMRTPLSSIVASLDFLAEDVVDVLPSESRGDIEEAVRGSERLMRMVDDLLDLSRLETGKMPISTQEVDLVRLVEGTLAGMASLMRGRKVGFDGGDEPIVISCDTALIRRVVENLVSNAVKYTREATGISVSVTTTNAGVRVGVRDYGPGIPEADRERIFKKFAQVDRRGKQAAHSSGVGLAFCQLAIEAHGGTVRVETPDGGGSEFSFDLPRREG